VEGKSLSRSVAARNIRGRAASENLKPQELTMMRQFSIRNQAYHAATPAEAAREYASGLNAQVILPLRIEQPVRATDGSIINQWSCEVHRTREHTIPVPTVLDGWRIWIQEI
jgi:hypothetical protein